MATKNIIIAPCGNKATIFKDFWLKDKDNKEFDICLLFYDDEIKNKNHFEEVSYFYHLKGFKYPMISKLLNDIHPEWLQKYEYFYFLDDDIEIDTNQINNMFSLSKTMNSWISCASLTHDSYCSWPLFKHDPRSFCRFVGQIEVMAPLFNQYSLQKCLPSFNDNKSSWGMDSVWPKILDYPENKLIIFDTVQMKHVNPVGGGDLYKKIGVNPHDEWKNIVQKYGAKKQNYREYGRYLLINNKRNRLLFAAYQMKEFKAKILRIWNDYDLTSRVKSRSQKLFSRIKAY
jgi:hypothetical protein